MYVAPYLSQYLPVSVAGFFISSGLMLLFGHRCQSTNPLMAVLLYIAVLLGASLCIEAYGYGLADPLLLLGLFVTSLPVTLSARSWNIVGRSAFVMTFQAALGFMVFVGWQSFASSTGWLGSSLAIVMLVLVTCAMLLMIAQAFELTDVLCRAKWQRRVTPQASTDYFPRVSLHVPAYNEPPEMVIATLDALSRIDYPNYEVIMIDDNTEDEALWKPVEAHCKKLGFKFIHLENWPGYKSGALNYATTKTDPGTEIIGIVDADYIVEPNYLVELVGQFRNPNMAFVQTPQDYREFDTRDRYLMALYRAYQYFFKLSMASRNERNGIIFTGTMGLIRRSVLEEVGGWDEWCITEDAEIAVKILDKGYESVFVDKTYGRGLMPLDFESLKKQRFRWAFGGMQVLRMHWRKLLPWRNSSEPGGGQLSLGQKMDFWLGGLQWLNDPITFLFTIFLLANSVAFMLTDVAFMQEMLGVGIFIPFVFILTNLARTLWGLRLRLQCSYRQAFQALLLLLSLTWVVSQACVLGLTRKAGVFLRTPKQADGYGFLKVLQIVNRELVVVGLCLAMIAVLITVPEASPMTWVFAALLSWQAFIYGSAVVASYWSYRSQILGASLGEGVETVRDGKIPVPQAVSGAASLGVMVGLVMLGVSSLVVFG